ncbi:histidine kinase [Planococcus glaciei]|uniref:histidine kinase n=1 Tax=Planococcus glaciei TaxID=459472 RepID=A0A7H8QB77_9BACL|nr:sensor histidine kinase [Planococcus glaciei]ETP68398.1 sensor histidine kinase [Planococcus glaciei CHR43]KOF10864.1 histidine kinase [Planococcus glaciei]MBX0315512.1 sensor histidine kinase [Planococcus glaciei]QDY45609.1 sensor histidine kinase [Planococcus glaciei]QKX50771.1 sensor histidine kinase [Planococcus glaciei]
MQSWYQIFPKNPWLSLYAWVIFCILPFFFIFRSSSPVEIAAGIALLVLFFIAYRLSFISRTGFIYVWVSIEIAINIGMTFLFGYVYLAIFLAFFIGNIRHKVGFFIVYGIHIGTTILAVVLGLIEHSSLYVSQLPFIVLSIIGVILLPFNTYNRNKREKLEGQLEDANKRISQLIVIEERERIARDLHDTLGQKLSLIGLKSDLAGKLIRRDADAALNEINDIRQTARTALKEVRELVSDMRGTKLEDELLRIQQILKAAEIDFVLYGSAKLVNTPLLVENVLSMCLKEAVTNVVKHSQATRCSVLIKQKPEEVLVQVQDDGIGFEGNSQQRGNGLAGMRERLEFVNGSVDIQTMDGTTLNIRVPNVILYKEKEEELI